MKFEGPLPHPPKSRRTGWPSYHISRLSSRKACVYANPCRWARLEKCPAAAPRCAGIGSRRMWVPRRRPFSLFLHFSLLSPVLRTRILPMPEPQTSVAIPQYASSLSALNYSSPTEFLPCRWLPPSHSWAATLISSPYTPASPPRPTANQAAFHPFSIGNRRCLGQSLAYLEMRLILARLLWKFDIEQDGKPWAWEEQKTWILWEKKPLNVRIRKRA